MTHIQITGTRLRRQRVRDTLTIVAAVAAIAWFTIAPLFE